MKLQIPQTTKLRLGSCPVSGTGGVNEWVFSTACALVGVSENDQEIYDLIRDGLSREPKRNEIERSITNARLRTSDLFEPTGGVIKSRLDEVKRRKILAANESMSVHFLGVNSDMPPDSPEAALDELFLDEDWVCCGRTSFTFNTRRLEDWTSLDGYELVVPNPMTEKLGKTQSGKPSQHTLSNTGARRWLVVEFDTGTRDQQAALIYYLAKRLLMKMVVDSGNKSLHAWFDVVGVEADLVEAFWTEATSIGADPATWTRSQFVRLPQATRKNTGTKQSIVYWAKGV